MRSDQELNDTQGTGSSSGKQYMGYMAADVESAMDPTTTIPNWMELLDIYTEPNAAALKAGPPATFSYADHERGSLDLYRNGLSPGAPALVMFHGGGFALMGKEDMAFAAPTFNAAGIAYIAPGYPLVPGVRLPELLSYCQRAVKWIYENAETLGIDRDRIYISGGSAGGFITAYLLTTDWRSFGLPERPFRGGMPLNGIFDIEPMMLSPRWSHVDVHDDEIRPHSPIHRLDKLTTPLFVAWAENEPPIFALSCEQFSEAARERGLLFDRHVAQGKNHFTMFLDIKDPQSLLFRKFAELILTDRP